MIKIRSASEAICFEESLSAHFFLFSPFLPGGQAVEQNHLRFLDDREVGLQDDLAHRETLEELVERDRAHEGNPSALRLQRTLMGQIFEGR